MSKYYISNAGVKLGPFEVSDLLLNGLTEETLVWRPGMMSWQPAALVEELRPLLSQAAEEPPALPGSAPSFDYSGQLNSFPQQPPAMSQQDYLGNRGVNSMTSGTMPSTAKASNIALIATLLCCFNPIAPIFGIIGLTKGSSSKAAFNSGNSTLAESYAADARKYSMWGWIAAVIWFVGLATFALLTDDKNKDKEPVKTEVPASESSASSAASGESVYDMNSKVSSPNSATPDAQPSAAPAGPSAPSPAPAEQQRAIINHRYL